MKKKKLYSFGDGVVNFFTDRWYLKLTALAVALILWLCLRFLAQ